ncbi:uncharacterized protein LOC132701559 isoform X2 [Cylas formicarius]|uniref:uncharacterized protein LOC132701559 isoform X2 n=1 Tax=Cylas formicarius TaxID=197179 RepID=UPI0029584228|nr:uncharacterized protein LOC132701559 isoform X2 [Cylas formicarius]
MAEKPDLAATTGVQNVVVYVSNENFGQAYAIDQQHNVQQQGNVHATGYPNENHTMASMASQKPYSDKQMYAASEQVVNANQGSYFANVISQNGFNPGYQNGALNKSYPNTELQPCEKIQAGPGRPENVKVSGNECERYADSYIYGSEVQTQSVRCDSVRSETAESSCSSLSSADEVNNQSPDMVVYDPSISVRTGNVMVAVGPPSLPQHSQASNAVSNSGQYVTVPYGWKRLLNNGSIIYISPSNTALSSPEQLKDYLLRSGTCKCGLECHFKYENVFNFDPKVVSQPWILSPDTNTGDLTKLCNHKRKMCAMASLNCKPPDPNVKAAKEFGVKRKKRKIGMPYCGSLSVSQILAQREKLTLNQQSFGKEPVGSPQQTWPQNERNNTQLSNRLQGFQDNQQPNQMVVGTRVMSEPPIVPIENSTVASQSNLSDNISGQHIQPNQQVPPNNPNIHLHQQHVIGQNGQIINIQGVVPPNPNGLNQNNGIVLQSQNFMQTQQQQQSRLFVSGQLSEPSGPGRPNLQIVPNQPPKSDIQHRSLRQPHQFYNPQHHQPIDPNKGVRPFNPAMNGFRPHSINNQNQLVSNSMQMQQYQMQQQQQQQRMQWQGRVVQQPVTRPPNPQMNQNVYERVPPLHQNASSPAWQDEIRRKKVRFNNKFSKSRQYQVVDSCLPGVGSCPNIDVRQISSESRPVVVSQFAHSNHSSSPSFMEDPSGYLAQQTALLNNTINRQTSANNARYACNSPNTPLQNPQQNMLAISTSQVNEVPLLSNVMKSQMHQSRSNQNILLKTQVIPENVEHSHPQYNQQINQLQNQQNLADSNVLQDHMIQQYSEHCQGCATGNGGQYIGPKTKSHSRPNSQPGTPSSCGTIEDPVTSSLYSDKHSNQPSPDSRPIQGGTVSTSNVSPADGSHSDPPTPNPHMQTPTPPQRGVDQIIKAVSVQQIPQSQQVLQIMNQPREINSSMGYVSSQTPKQEVACCSYPHSNVSRGSERGYISVVTTMASGRTVGSNTITSVLAGRANTATVSINNPGANPPASNIHVTNTVQSQALSVNVSKSPLEMVQSVVSSIQVPQSQQQGVLASMTQSSPQISPQILKHSPTGLPPGHILVSSNGQLIMASAGNGQNNVMAPPPPKVVANPNSMPPISVSPMITNVTASVAQVIPAVAQQVLGQQTVLVNALPTPFVLQPGVTMTMDGMTVGQNVQIPQLVAGNVIQQPIHLENSDPRRAATLLSPDTKKKGKKRKLPSQTVASMLHIAAQQNSGVVMSQQGFPQQIQMAHSPQGITTTPVMQALTIVPSKNGGPPQIVMNSQPITNNNLTTQQLITNSQPAQQINLLQPVNLINGTTGVVQNFPTIQQFIVPNLGSMVMNADGTATILQDTSNLGMQLQIQNVNGQNVLTPIQNNNMFNNSQGILAAGPAGMVIRAPSSQGKIIQQQHSPGAQFLSPNGGQFVVNGTQFSGQLSPLVANVSPSQQVTFNTSPQQIRSNSSIQPAQQEFIQMNSQMGQTLMVPCNASSASIAAASTNQHNQQNTTFVQQNTTIVQQQTTMVANNQQLQNFQQNSQQNQHNVARTAPMNVDQQNFILSDSKQMQAVVLQQRNSPQNSTSNYRQSVSTQTAVNQNAQSVTTNTFCQTSTLSASSPPDTTTLSPAASGGQSPPTADTTTHSGSTDDGLSPAPSTCSITGSDVNLSGPRPQSCAMAMVHCISSSEPDLAESSTQNSEQDWRKFQNHMAAKMTQEFTDISAHMQYGKRPNELTHVTFAESSNMVAGMHFLNKKMKQDVVSSKNYEKSVHQRKNSEMVLIMESQMSSPLFDDEEVEN